MRGADRQVFRNLNATPASFALEGGYYVLDVNATFGGGNVVLNRLSIDGVTQLAAITPITANGITPIYLLTAGIYQLAITTATGVYVTLQRITGTAL